MIQQFYILKPEGDELFGTKFAYGQMGTPYSLGDCEYCPKCHSAVSMLLWLPLHRLELSSSKPEKWGDFLFGADYHPFVSAKFKSIFEQEELKGLITFHPPAKIIKLGTKSPKDVIESLPVYHMMEIPCEGAEIDIEASHMVYNKPSNCDKCKQSNRIFKSHKGLIIKENSWIGLDIFRPWGGLNYIFVTERFKSVLEKYKPTNYLLYPADQWWEEEPNLNPFYTHEDAKREKELAEQFRRSMKDAKITITLPKGFQNKT